MIRRTWKEHPMTQLVAARLREFFRQPEAVFWVYVFPTLMMISLDSGFALQTIYMFDSLNWPGEKWPMVTIDSGSTSIPATAWR